MKRIWRHFLEYVSNYKKTILLNYVIFLILITILLIIDLLTKHFLFNVNDSSITYSNWLFGIRSLKNPGLTFFPGNTNVALVTFFNIIILLACLFGILFLRNYWIVVFVSFIFSGSLGNTIDRLSFHYVRDIIFLPWCDLGTFNFADMDVIVGSFGCVATWAIIAITNYYKNK
ncbi:MAG: signal peptidase II [Mycoplasma sp.]|nr:signal peptidase II [Mycoplasma sp.]